MTNPVPGLCPCCQDPLNSVFMQTIHSDFLFKMISQRGDFKRNYLFCNMCIDWAKQEVMKLRDQALIQNPRQSPISESGGNRCTPDPFALAESHHEPAVQSDNIVAQRLAGQTASPVHMNHSILPYFLPNEPRPAEPVLRQRNRPSTLWNTADVVPLSSPLNDVNPWEVDDRIKRDDSLGQPE